MCAITASQNHQAGAVEVYTAEMYVIRILLRLNSAGLKPDLPFFLIYVLNSADNPPAPGYLVFNTSSLGVVEIEMVPAVPLRHPDNFVRFVEVMTELFAGVVDESLALFIDDGTGLTRRGIHTYDTQYLVTSLVIEEREPARIGQQANI